MCIIINHVFNHYLLYHAQNCLLSIFDRIPALIYIYNEPSFYFIETQKFGEGFSVFYFSQCLYLWSLIHRNHVFNFTKYKNPTFKSKI